MTKPDAGPDREALKRAFADYHRRKTICRSDGCRWGYVVLDPEDIDTFTEEPRRTPHDKCAGSGFIDRQMDLFHDQA